MGAVAEWTGAALWTGSKSFNTATGAGLYGTNVRNCLNQPDDTQ